MRTLTTIFLTLGICSCTVSVPSIESHYATQGEVNRQFGEVAKAFNALSGKVAVLEKDKEQEDAK
jgi:hypothetical protein